MKQKERALTFEKGLARVNSCVFNCLEERSQSDVNSVSLTALGVMRSSKGSSQAQPPRFHASETGLHAGEPARVPLLGPLCHVTAGLRHAAIG